MYPQSKPSRKHLLIVSFCLLSGCSAMNVHDDDKSDICYTWRSQLRDSEHYYAQSVAEGAVIGGLIGAGTGALGALIGGGNVGTGALIGGGVGAVAGGVGGYYNAKQKDIADGQALAASVRNDIVAANGEIDRTSVAFAKLRDCRFAAAERVKSEFKAGRVPRDTAVKQLNDLKRQFDEDIKIAQDLGLKMGTRLTEFQDANNKILDNNPSARTVLYVEKTSPTLEETKQVAPEAVKSTKKKNKNNKKTSIPNSTSVASKSSDKPQTSVVTKPTSAAVEVAHVTETNQIKQKAFVDQIDNAKAQAKNAFALEGSVSLNSPETMLCGL
jgi:outer membrane lipoprotein SlyB